LPPPAELGDLPLHVLIEILTSAKPLHLALQRCLSRQKGAGVDSPQLLLDPHERVDTSTFLIQRARRVSWAFDALRKRLERLAGRPGLVLADEVGMGKTFVALAVAASVALSDRDRPVVVMVPPSLKEKWPRDFGVFVEQCLTRELRSRLRPSSAQTGVQFLKLLAD